MTREGKLMAEEISLKTIVVASKENVSCALGDEAAILHMHSGVYYGLDPVGARIWKLLEFPRSVEDLRTTILDEFEVESAKCETDLLGLLEKLRAEGLIEIRGE
jgi:Coenzyme PQQ synthesis protein D (PqqD)